MWYGKSTAISITTGGLWSSNPVGITCGVPIASGLNVQPQPLYVPLQLGAAVPLRKLTQRQAVQILPQWIRWALNDQLQVIATGSVRMLKHEVLTLTLGVADYALFRTLLDDEPWTSGYHLPEPLLTQWIASSIQTVFTFAP